MAATNPIAFNNYEQALIDEFKRKYVTSKEICDRLGISCSGLSKALSRKTFPEPLNLKIGIHIWEREFIEPKIKEWKLRSFKNGKM